jgi:hypothetical protein
MAGFLLDLHVVISLHITLSLLPDAFDKGLANAGNEQRHERVLPTIQPLHKTQFL